MHKAKAFVYSKKYLKQLLMIKDKHRYKQNPELASTQRRIQKPVDTA